MKLILTVASKSLARLAHVLHRVREWVEWARIGAAVPPTPVRPDTEPARPPEHPNFSVVWPGGDPAKGGRFDDPQ